MNKTTPSASKVTAHEVCDLTEEEYSSCSESSSTESRSSDSNTHTDELETTENSTSLGQQKEQSHLPSESNDFCTNLFTVPKMLTSITLVYVAVSLIPTLSTQLGLTKDGSQASSVTR